MKFRFKAGHLLEAAQSMLSAGLCVLPARRDQKRPTLAGWKNFQSQLPTTKQIEHWFAGDVDAICVVTGKVSGNLELIDFDFGAELFEDWAAQVPRELFERLFIASSQSGGRHVAYRCEEAIGGNMKLAQTRRDEKLVTLIETRGEGGLFLCHPTPGYTIEQGTLIQLPVLNNAEREQLLEAAWQLNHIENGAGFQPAIGANQLASPSHDQRPGDDFNERGDVRDLLQRHGWTLVRGGANECWRRPGKTDGWSATLRDRVLFVFSSNAEPFETERGYAPFSVFAMLEHGGNFAAAALALRTAGFGGTEVNNDVDLSNFNTKAFIPAGGQHEVPPGKDNADPGPVPEELLRIPGFISEVMDHCLATAPYPNVALSFCGALALQATLAGRKVRDQADNRSNLYLLALAYSSVGKDWPRKINTHIMHRAGLVNALGEKFASGEGIQDSLFLTPTMLFQTDEIDGLLQSINKSRDARHENIMGTLLTMYSAANSIYPMRRKAGKEAAGVIDQPCMVVYGTAIPTHYYEALSERMLTNGFFARMVIVESGPRSVGQEPGIIAPSERILETAKRWSEFNPGEGNLESWHPQPLIVEATTEAKRLLSESREASEFEYAAAESRGDPVGTTVWGRVPEQIRKLSLVYAASVNYRTPQIDGAAVRWATDFMLHQTRRMLFMAHNHVAENPFHAECLKLLRKLRDAPDRMLPHSVLLKRMKTDAKTFQELISTLEQQGDVATVSQSTSGRPQRAYRLTADALTDSEMANEAGEKS